MIGRTRTDGQGRGLGPDGQGWMVKAGWTMLVGHGKANWKGKMIHGVLNTDLR